MNAEQEAPGAVSDGSGFFSYTTTSTELCYTLQVRDLSGSPIAAHIHLAPRHVPGPVVVPLATPPAATGSVTDCITATEGGAMTPAELGILLERARGLLADDGQEALDVQVERSTIKADLVGQPGDETGLFPAATGRTVSALRAERVSPPRVVATASRLLFDTLAGIYDDLGFDVVTALM